MLVCRNCREQMVVASNDCGVNYGGGHVYSADLWRCPSCGHEVAVCNSNPHHDPGYTGSKVWVDMGDAGMDRAVAQGRDR